MYRRSQFNQICGIPVQGKKLNWNDYYKEPAVKTQSTIRKLPRKNKTVKGTVKKAYEDGENRRYRQTMYPRPETPRLCPCEHRTIIRSPQGSEFGIEQQLGAGGFGTAFNICWIEENKKLALKVMNFTTEEEIVIAETEAQNNRMLSHIFPKAEFFPMFYEIFVIDGRIYFIMEKLDRDLRTFVANLQNTCVDLKYVKLIGRQILEAVSYLHMFGFVHCDLKLENIMFVNPPLVQKDLWRIKLIDFGLMKTRDYVMNLQGSTFGTYTYWAPEMFFALPMTEKIDIWSVGIILLELFTGRSLFGKGCRQQSVLAHFIRIVGLPENARTGAKFGKIFVEDEATGELFYRDAATVQTGICSYNYVGFEALHKIPFLDEGVPNDQIPKTVDDILFKKLLTLMLHPDDASRITVYKALKHRFFDLN